MLTRACNPMVCLIHVFRYQFNDARVSLSSAEAVSRLQAYILFYEKS